MSLLAFCALFSLNPVREYATTPADYGLKFEEVSIKTSDNYVLYGWLYKPNQEVYKLIILSDDGDGNMADLIELASYFVSLGYNVLTYDYRGYGKSQDFEIKPDFYIYAQFEKDLNAAIDYVKKYHSRNRTIHLYGKGIGAGLSLAVGAMRCSEISRIIADSPYSTLDDVQKAIKQVTGKEVKLPLGYDKNMLEPYFALQSKGASLSGILLIYGKEDPIYNETMMKKIAKTRPSLVQMEGIKKSTYENTFSINKEEYYNLIKKFLS
ncbi:MAG: alpha/beta hydrolase [Bacteroidales bacterium]|nr:alpha/beta hydrolase [Bacteroidales bacterium]